MNITLINPRVLNIAQHPPGLLYVVAVLEKEGHKVRVYDPLPGNGTFIKSVIKKDGPDIIGLTCTTTQVNRAVDILKKIKKVDHIIAVSKHARWELIKEWGIPLEKVTFIPNGVDVEAFKPKGKKEPMILFVGKLTRRKGVEYLIRAYAEVASEDFRLIIVGDGEERSRLERLVRMFNLQRKVTFLGYVSKETLQALYTKARIFVLPSLAEGFPLTLLEAMSCGCAVVATKVSGLLDVVNDDNGFLVEPGSVDALAEKLGLLMGDQKTTEYMGRRGRECVSRKYSWENIASKTLTVYERSLSG